MLRAPTRVLEPEPVSAEPSRTLRGEELPGGAAPGGPARLLSYVLNIAVFAGVFFVASAVASRELPVPNIMVLKPKLEHFAANKDVYNTLFVGSSRVYRELVPEIFEEEMAAQGHLGVKAFNLGVPGMRVPEALYVLKQVLATQPAKLRWVFFELRAFDTQIDERNAFSKRMVFWHDWAETARAVGAILAGDAPLWDEAPEGLVPIQGKLSGVVSHLRHFLFKLANVGRGVEQFTFLPANRAYSLFRANELAEMFGQRAGYVALEDEVSPIFQERHDDFLADEQERFAELLAEMTSPDVYTPPFTDYNRLLIETVIEMVEQAGAQVVFTILPVMVAEKHFQQAYEDGVIPELIALNKPGRFPFLYRVDQRWDLAHLKRPASQACTRLFVKELDSMIKSR